MASLSTPPTEYYDIPSGYMEVRESPPPGIKIGDKVQIVTTINNREYSQKLKHIDSILISNGPFIDAEFKKFSANEGHNHENDYAYLPDNEVVVSTDTAQQKTLNQLTDGERDRSSFYFVIPRPDNEISKVTFTFVKPPFMTLTGNFLKQFNVSHMKSILRNHFKCVPKEHSTRLVLHGDGEKPPTKLDNDFQQISELGDNPKITFNVVKFKGKGGRKSRRLNSKKNKRTRRKSLKKQHRRRK